MPPITRYVSVDGARLAYQVFGDGPVDVVMSAGCFSHTDVLWEDPAAAVFLTRLASFARVIRYDRLGISNSDPLPHGWEPTVADYGRELDAVLDASGADDVALLAMLDAGPFAIRYAAAASRVGRLILYNTTPRFEAGDDYDIGLPRSVLDQLFDHIDTEWGTEAQVGVNVPSRVDDQRFASWYAKYVRSLGTPTTILSILRRTTTVDAREFLDRVSIPTLVVHRAAYPVIPATHGRYAADRIPGATYVEVPGSDGPMFWETPDVILGHLRDFLAGDTAASAGRAEFATILFTDIVRSTEIVERMGDHEWRSVIDIHRANADAVVAQHEGRLVKWTGDGVLATFPDPARAIAAAEELRLRSRAMGIGVRVGVHAGRIEAADDDVTGIAVHIAARVMATADDGEIVASRTVRDLLLGSRHRFRGLGAQHLRGIGGEWELYALERGERSS